MVKECDKDLMQYENSYYEDGRRIIAGTDEAGRGPLAGPVVAAAVIFARGTEIKEINDSKKLSEKQRARIYNEIIEKSLCYSIIEVDNKTIDEINILQASLLAMKKAVEALETKPDIVLIDGNFTFKTGIETKAIIKGDSLSFSIAAASILAKVHRDDLMLVYDKMYPEYEFARHKGYPTKLHYERLLEYGACPIHRMTFNLKI